MPFADVFPAYVAKVERKGRTVSELNTVIKWLTGFSDAELKKHLKEGTIIEEFFSKAKLNPNATLISGTICGVKI